MVSLKSAALASALMVGLAGAAMAQVMPGMSGSPGRGNSSTSTMMPNGGVMSNGQTMEPRTMRSRKSMRAGKMKRSRKMRSSM